MKIQLFSLSLLCLTTVSAKAQVALMPEAGINLSNMAFGGNVINARSNSLQYKPGLKAGVSLAVPLGRVTFFQPGLFFSNKGSKNNKEQYYLKGGSSTNINYLEIPVNFGYIRHFPKGGSFFMTAGPYAGIALSASTTNVYGTTNIPFNSYGLKQLDMGLNVGMGYKLPFGVFLRAQYAFGFMNISGNNATTVTNHGLGFSAGYYYVFKASAQRSKQGNQQAGD